MILQRTLQNAIRATGMGLHSGQRATLVLNPAPVDSGIVFQCRTDHGWADIPALSSHVVSTRLATVLGDHDGNRVSTVEHLLAALAGLGVDNCRIQISGNEVPIMDGSAAPFVFLIQSAGVVEQPGPRRLVRITRPLQVRDGDAWVRLDPHPGLLMEMCIDFDHDFFAHRPQRLTIDFSRTSFLHEVCRARTFGFSNDIGKLRKENRALGASLQNALVIGDDAVLNPGGLRYPDEPVRHKMLDAIGDLYQLGAAIIGKFSGYKSGHQLNHLLVEALLQSPHCFETVGAAVNDLVDADRVCGELA